MKPFLICFIASWICAAPVFSQRLSRSMPVDPVPESSKEIFAFILKLDSLDYDSGSIHFRNSITRNLKKVKQTKVSVKFNSLSDSMLSVRIKSHNYLLHSLTGRVIDAKNGRFVYRDLRVQIREFERSNITGTDSLGKYTARFGNFRKDVPSNIDYDPISVSPDKSIQYKIRRTPFSSGSADSSWIEDDTTRIIRQYHNGKLISERTEKTGITQFPQIYEYHYSYSGDTTIARLTLFENGFGANPPNGLTITPVSLIKSLRDSTDNKTHSYRFVEDENYKTMLVSDNAWKPGENGFYLSETYRENFYIHQSNPQKIIEKTRIYFSGKK